MVLAPNPANPPEEKIAMSQADLTRDWIRVTISELRSRSHTQFLLQFVNNFGSGLLDEFDHSGDHRLSGDDVRNAFEKAMFGKVVPTMIITQSNKPQSRITSEWIQRTKTMIKAELGMHRQHENRRRLENLVTFFGTMIQFYQEVGNGNVSGRAARIAVLIAIEAVFFGSNRIFSYRK